MLSLVCYSVHIYLWIVFFRLLLFLKILKSVQCVIFSHVLHTHNKTVRAPRKDLLKFLQLHHLVYLSYIVSKLLKALIFLETSLPGRCP